MRWASPSATPAWRLKAGPCIINGTCIASVNYPENYENGHACEFSPRTEGQLNVVHFKSESGWDTLTVGDTYYHGNGDGLHGMVVDNTIQSTF
eukprot:gene57643-biopygen89341